MPDVFVALLTGLTVGEPVPVQVILTGSGPELSGHGAISRSHSAELCKGTDLIDLTRRHPVTGLPAGAHVGSLGACTDRHCRFRDTGARGDVDLDHVIPHPSGPTEHTNLAALCRYHHRLKTHTPWSVQMLDGAVLRWTSPRGHVFHQSR